MFSIEVYVYGGLLAEANKVMKYNLHVVVLLQAEEIHFPLWSTPAKFLNIFRGNHSMAEASLWGDYFSHNMVAGDKLVVKIAKIC